MAFALTLCRLSASVPAKYEQHLAQIDNALQKKESYTQTLNEQIAILRGQLVSVRNEEEQYTLNNLLIHKFENYISDSALFYINKNLDLARNSGHQQWRNETLLSQINIYIQTGLLTQASELMKGIHLQELSDNAKAQYYALNLFLYTQNSRLTGNSNNAESQQYTDSLTRYAKDIPGLYAWAMFWGYYEPDRNNKLLTAFLPLYKKNLQENSPMAGSNAYMIASFYRVLGEHDLYIQYLCESVVNNIRYVNRDHTSLLELVSYLIAEGDYQRAYRYMDYMVELQTEFPDNVRSIQMGQYLKQIHAENQKISDRQQRQTNNYLYGLLVALSILLLAFILLVRLMYKQRKQQQAITEINEQLHHSISQLQETQQLLQSSNQLVHETNNRLTEANYIKEQYIGHLFSLCSEYINKMDSYRQEIHRKLMAGQTEDVVRRTRPENSSTRSEVKELNRIFDATFLSIYPDFITDFYNLLADGEQPSLSAESLNTELRIYALVWLGITSSIKIAELLHLSPQTVYNARQKLRTKCKEPNLTTEQFDSKVQALGRDKISCNLSI